MELQPIPVLMPAAVHVSRGNGANVGRGWTDRVLVMAVMTGRQQQAALQAFYPSLEFDATASDSLIDPVAHIRERRWALLGENTVLRR